MELVTTTFFRPWRIAGTRVCRYTGDRSELAAALCGVCGKVEQHLWLNAVDVFLGCLLLAQVKLGKVALWVHIAPEPTGHVVHAIDVVLIDQRVNQVAAHESGGQDARLCHRVLDPPWDESAFSPPLGLLGSRKQAFAARWGCPLESTGGVHKK